MGTFRIDPSKFFFLIMFAISFKNVYLRSSGAWGGVVVKALRY